jgi:flavin reductase (DIM6/NTAB) family NADH-FMN oxidoreductase RutF
MNNTRPLIHPVPIVVVGVLDGIEGSRVNFTTIGDIAIAGLNPPLLMLSLHERHLSRQIIDDKKKLTVHIPEVKWLDQIDYCGVHSGHDMDKSSVFPFRVYRGFVVIDDFPINLLCRVRERIQVDKRVIFVVEVDEMLLRSDVTIENLGSLNTILYGLNNRYYSSGKEIGEGYYTAKKGSK